MIIRLARHFWNIIKYEINKIWMVPFHKEQPTKHLCNNSYHAINWVFFKKKIYWTSMAWSLEWLCFNNYTIKYFIFNPVSFKLIDGLYFEDIHPNFFPLPKCRWVSMISPMLGWLLSKYHIRSVWLTACWLSPTKTMVLALDSTSLCFLR